MKKIFLTLLFFTMIYCNTLADDKTDVLNKFDSYVNSANEYSNNLANYYSKDAKIIRVVNKKQGGQKFVVIPFDRYLSELQSHAKLARIVGYKNQYTDRKISKVGNNYKISANRVPRNDKKGLPSYFIFAKDGEDWKIIEESMTTNVQTFLNAK